MSREFADTDHALGYLRALFKLGKDVSFEMIYLEPIPGGLGAGLLLAMGEAENASPEDKRITDSIRAKMAGQKTFRAVRGGEEVLFDTRGVMGKMHFTIGPFRSGVDCWLIGEDGIALRL